MLHEAYNSPMTFADEDADLEEDEVQFVSQVVFHSSTHTCYVYSVIIR